MLKLTAFLTLTITVASQAGNWPQFRGADGQGHTDATGLPLHWSETNHVKWKTPIPGEGWSSPVVWEDQIWLTTASEDGRSLRVVQVALADGKLVRDFEVFHLDKAPHKHAFNSHASPTPVIEAGRLYVSFGTYGTACCETRSGEILWRNTELQLDHENGPGSSPALHGSRLIIPCDGTNTQFVAALEKATGKLAWKTPRSGASLATIHPERRKAYCTPLGIRVGDREQLIIPGGEYVYAYAPDTGQELWQAHYPGFSNVPRPLFADGVLYVCTGFTRPELWAIRPDGAGDVTATHVLWKYARQVPAKPSPVAVKDRIFMVSDGGLATCLDAKTGKELWQERVKGEYTASPIAAEGRLYLFNQEGTGTILEAADQFKVIAENKLADGFMASPAVAGKALLLRAKESLYCIEE